MLTRFGSVNLRERDLDVDGAILVKLTLKK